MRTRAPWLGALAAALCLTAAPAAFGQAVVGGFAQANVVTPGSIVPLNGLRFGQFIRPVAAGTMTIDIAGAATATGGVVAGYTIVQTGTGRGPATFALTGRPNRQCDVILPVLAVLTSGVQTMTVTNFTANTNGGGKIRLDASGFAQLIVGGRLNVAANQAVGNYTGSYILTVAFQ